MIAANFDLWGREDQNRKALHDLIECDVVFRVLMVDNTRLGNSTGTRCCLAIVELPVATASECWGRTMEKSLALVAALSSVFSLPLLQAQQKLIGQRTNVKRPVSGKTLAAKKYRVTTIGFTPDKKQLVTGTYNGRVHFWDLNLCKPSKSFVHHKPEHKRLCAIRALAISNNGKFVATTIYEGKVRGSVCLWEFKSKKLNWRKNGITHADCIVFSPDSKYVAVSAMKHVWLFAVTTGDVIWQTKIDPGIKSQIKFSADGKRLFFSGYGFSHIRILDVVAKKQIGRIQFPCMVASFAVSEHSGSIFVGSHNQPIFQHGRSGKGNAKAVTKNLYTQTRSIWLLRKDAEVLVEDRLGRLSIWRRKDGKRIGRFKLPKHSRATVSNDHKTIAILDSAGNISVLELASISRDQRR